MVNIELKNAVKSVLEQLAAVVGQMSQNDFKKPVNTLNNATVGQHVRHHPRIFYLLAGWSYQRGSELRQKKITIKV